MYSFKSILCAFTLACVFCAHADDLEPWGDGSQGTEWSWNFEENTLTILRGNNNDYRFWVHDGGGDPNTGVINNITVYDPNDNIGDFSLLIGYPLDPNDPNSAVDPNKPGALHVRAGDLRYDGGTATVLGLYLAGDLATDDDVYFESVAGDIDIAGKLDKDGYSQEQTHDLIVNDGVAGDILVEELHGEIIVPNGTVNGDITTGAVPFTPRTGGGVNIAGSYSRVGRVIDPTALARGTFRPGTLGC